MSEIEKILDIFVERLDDYMKSNNLNVAQFAIQLNIPRRTLNSWILKNRVPRIDYIYQIADFLNVSVDYLIGREE